MKRVGGKRKRWRIASFVMALAFVFSIAWQARAAAQQTLAEQLLEIMRANHQITEEQYKQLKKIAEAEKAGQAAAAARQEKTEARTVKISEQIKPLIEFQPRTEVTPQEKPLTEIPPDTGMQFNMKGIKVNVGGFIEAAGIYRQRNENADIGSTYNNLPLPYQPNYYQDETRFSARQSRLSILAQGDYSSTVHLAGYYEMDFLGAAHTANSNESNSFNLRIRHLYATSDWDTWGLHLLAGQEWSLVTQNTGGITPRKEQIPLTIDAQYVPGFNWARQPQFRITKDWDKTFWLALSVENPQTTSVAQPNTVPTNFAVGYETGGGLFDSTNKLSVNDVPDIVAKAAWESPFGHFEVFNLTRTFESSLAAGPAKTLTVHNEDIVRDAVGGGVDIPIIPKQLDVMASAMYGPGIGRYGSGQLPDVTQDSTGFIHPITETHLLTGLIWWPFTQLQVYAYFGYENAERKDLDALTKGKLTGYGYGSNLFDVVDQPLNFASFQGSLETIDQFTIGDWWNFYQGKYGLMTWGIQYSWTDNKYFSGNSTGKVGGATLGGPRVSDNMIFTSLRYYWR